MYVNNWMQKYTDALFTRAQARVKKALGKKYGDIEFTTETRNPITHFPTVSFAVLNGNEIANTTEADFINGFKVTIQLNCYHGTDQEICEDIIWKVIEAVKLEGYTVTMPIFDTSNQAVYCSMTRVSKQICNLDV